MDTSAPVVVRESIYDRIFPDRDTTSQLMKYELTFTDRGKKALTRLDTENQERVKRKLNRIATCHYRHPADWDFEQMPGYCEGRFCITGNLRVFADIDEKHGIIRIHHIGRRENLYT